MEREKLISLIKDESKNFGESFGLKFYVDGDDETIHVNSKEQGLSCFWIRGASIDNPHFSGFNMIIVNEFLKFCNDLERCIGVDFKINIPEKIVEKKVVVQKEKIVEKEVPSVVEKSKLSVFEDIFNKKKITIENF